MKNRRASVKINFTKKKISSLPKPESGRVYVYDVRTPGLALCVTEKGARTEWHYRLSAQDLQLVGRRRGIRRSGSIW